MNSNKISLLIFSLLAILIFILGIGVGYSLNKLNPYYLSQIKLEVAKKLVEELREEGIIPPTPEEIKEISGTIDQIQDNQIILSTDMRPDDPLREFVPATVLVEINKDTKILANKEKDPAQLQKEEERFQALVNQYGGNPPAEIMPPEPFEKVSISLSDLKKGDHITVFSSQDIKKQSKIVAESILAEPISSSETIQ